MSESLFPKKYLEGFDTSCMCFFRFLTFHDFKVVLQFFPFVSTCFLLSLQPNVSQVVLHFPENQLSTTWGSLIFAAAAARLSSETDATCHQSLEIFNKYLELQNQPVFYMDVWMLGYFPTISHMKIWFILQFKQSIYRWMAVFRYMSPSREAKGFGLLRLK